MPNPTDRSHTPPHGANAGAARAQARIVSAARMNTLGFSQHDLDQFLDQVDASQPSSAAIRTFIRRAYRHVRIPMQVAQPGGNVATFPVACRNVSRGGISVLHNAYLHVGTRCTLALPAAGGGHTAAHGTIVRCQHRRGMIHEIGVRFDALVDLRPLLGLDLFADWYSRERLDPADLKGILLYVEESAADRKLVRYHLRDTNLTVVTADDAAQGLAKAASGADAVLWALPAAAPPDDPGEFVRALRERGVKAPVLILAADTGEAMRRTLAATPAQAFLAKPVSQGLLIRALAEFLLPAAGPGTGATAEPAGPAAAPSREFLAALPALVESLERAASSGDAGACRAACLRIRAGGGVLAEPADGALDAIAQEGLAGAAGAIARLAAAARTMLGQPVLPADGAREGGAPGETGDAPDGEPSTKAA
jgi:CheY-like chemotaxis protein